MHNTHGIRTGERIRTEEPLNSAVYVHVAMLPQPHSFSFGENYLVFLAELAVVVNKSSKHIWQKEETSPLDLLPFCFVSVQAADDDYG